MGRSILHCIFLTLKTKQMTNKERNQLIKYIETNLSTSQQMWENEESHAKIIGMLEGTLKSILIHLEINH
jgi:hypothetical protein